MATGRDNKLTGAVGEFLVSAQLCRHGLMATPFSGNVPHYDIIASDQFGGHVVVQVKAINRESWQSDISKFVTISIDNNFQVLGEPLAEPYPHLYCVFVALGDTSREDRYFIFPWLTLRDEIIKHYQSYLNDHGGRRPKSPKSLHCSIGISLLEHYEDKWGTIIDAAKLQRPI